LFISNPYTKQKGCDKFQKKLAKIIKGTTSMASNTIRLDKNYFKTSQKTQPASKITLLKHKIIGEFAHRPFEGF